MAPPIRADDMAAALHLQACGISRELRVDLAACTLEPSPWDDVVFVEAAAAALAPGLSRADFDILAAAGLECLPLVWALSSFLGRSELAALTGDASGWFLHPGVDIRGATVVGLCLVAVSREQLAAMSAPLEEAGARVVGWAALVAPPGLLVTDPLAELPKP